MSDIQMLTDQLPALTTKRDSLPAGSVIRCRYSNLVQQIKALSNYTLGEWVSHPSQTLAFEIKLQLADIAAATPADVAR